tara:strand:- start:2801 stop:3259 length:459 start_codon:yes stop_codon:yes gene_type:complete
MPIQGVDNVKKMLAKNKREANKKVRGVFLAGLGPIIEATPADSGAHRNNWFLTTGVPSGLYGRSESKSASGSHASLATMPSWVLNRKLYFTNNGPAITTLEYGGYPSPVEKGSYIKKSKSYEILSVNGYSKQAPTGWVRKAVILMRNKIRSL